jgi:hypothetical protein
MDTSNLIPIEKIASRVHSGLDYVIATIPAAPAPDDLADTVYTYMKTFCYPAIAGLEDEQLKIEIKSIIRAAIVGYLNSSEPYPFGETAVKPELYLLAEAIGRNAELYWSKVIANLDSLPWKKHIPEGFQADIPLLKAAAITGALTGYAAASNNMLERYVSHKEGGLLSGALAVSAGKIIFNLIPKGQAGGELNFQTIANLNEHKPKVSPREDKRTVQPKGLLLRELSVWE